MYTFINTFCSVKIPFSKKQAAKIIKYVTSCILFLKKYIFDVKTNL